MFCKADPVNVSFVNVNGSTTDSNPEIKEHSWSCTGPLNSLLQQLSTTLAQLSMSYIQFFCVFSSPLKYVKFEIQLLVYGKDIFDHQESPTPHSQ
jgi:hypothetical protein